MSLLPQTIPPYSHSFGKANDVDIVIDKNWWLFFYNIAQNVLGTNEGLPASSLTELASLDADVADVDAIVLRRPIDNAVAQLTLDTVASSSDLPDIARALLLAQDPLLPDPSPVAQPVSNIAVGASPFTTTAAFNGHVAVTGGTVSAIALIRQGTTVATGLTAGLIPASRGDQVKVTYAVAPTMTFIPQ